MLPPDGLVPYLVRYSGGPFAPLVLLATMNASTSCQVMLVDDEPSVASALNLLLQALGHIATPFTDPYEAVAALAEDPTVHLMLCDLRMPGMNGIETLKAVRSQKPTLPFVLMSAHATAEDVEEARKYGANGFLSKPFTPDQLRNMVRDISSGALTEFRSW